MNQLMKKPNYVLQAVDCPRKVISQCQKLSYYQRNGECHRHSFEIVSGFNLMINHYLRHKITAKKDFPSSKCLENVSWKLKLLLQVVYHRCWSAI